MADLSILVGQELLKLRDTVTVPTRIYFPSGTFAADVTVTADAAWTSTAGSVARKAVTDGRKRGTAAASVTTTGTTTNPETMLHAQYISKPLRAQTLSGNIRGQFRALESAAAANATLQIGIRVVSKDGATVRATLLAVGGTTTTSATPPELATSLTNRRLLTAGDVTPLPLSSYTCMDGDRLVIEIGTNNKSATAGQTHQVSFGDNTVDIQTDDTTTTANDPWIEFDSILYFQDQVEIVRLSESGTTQMMNQGWVKMDERNQIAAAIGLGTALFNKEQLRVSDTATVVLDLGVLVATESLTLADGPPTGQFIGQSISANVSESLKLAETPTVTEDPLRATPAEALTPVDGPATYLPIWVVQAPDEVVHVVDAGRGATSLIGVLHITDTVSAALVTGSNLATTITAETVLLADTVTAARGLTPAVADEALKLADSVSAQLDWGVILTESPTIADTGANYVTTVSAKGALALWRFDRDPDSNGFVVSPDVLGGHDATSATANNGGILTQQPGAISDGDAAISLDGTSASYFTVPDAAWLHLTSEISLDGWFKIPTGTSGSTRSLVANGPSGPILDLRVRFNGTQLSFTVSDVELSVTLDTQPDFDVYHHLAGSYDGSTMRLFLDGALVASQAQSGTLNVGTNGLTLGGSGTVQHWIGSLDDCALYNRGLTASDVRAIYLAGRRYTAAGTLDPERTSPSESLKLADTASADLNTTLFATPASEEGFTHLQDQAPIAQLTPLLGTAASESLRLSDSAYGMPTLLENLRLADGPVVAGLEVAIEVNQQETLKLAESTPAGSFDPVEVLVTEPVKLADTAAGNMAALFLLIPQEVVKLSDKVINLGVSLTEICVLSDVGRGATSLIGTIRIQDGPILTQLGNNLNTLVNPESLKLADPLVGVERSPFEATAQEVMKLGLDLSSAAEYTRDEYASIGEVVAVSLQAPTDLSVLVATETFHLADTPAVRRDIEVLVPAEVGLLADAITVARGLDAPVTADALLLADAITAIEDEIVVVASEALKLADPAPSRTLNPEQTLVTDALGIGEELTADRSNPNDLATSLQTEVLQLGEALAASRTLTVVLGEAITLAETFDVGYAQNLLATPDPEVVLIADVTAPGIELRAPADSDDVSIADQVSATLALTLVIAPEHITLDDVNLLPGLELIADFNPPDPTPSVPHCVIHVRPRVKTIHVRKRE